MKACSSSVGRLSLLTSIFESPIVPFLAQNTFPSFCGERCVHGHRRCTLGQVGLLAGGQLLADASHKNTTYVVHLPPATGSTFTPLCLHHDLPGGGRGRSRDQWGEEVESETSEERETPGVLGTR